MFTSGELEGVAIIPIIHYKGKKVPSIILIANYRPTIENYNLEFVAGMIDKRETVKEAAARELKEETGLIAKEIVH